MHDQPVTDSNAGEVGEILFAPLGHLHSVGGTEHGSSHVGGVTRLVDLCQLVPEPSHSCLKQLV